MSTETAADRGRRQDAPADVAVVIATYKRAALLTRTLDSLASSDVRRPWIVAVVDNNSSDRTRQVVAEHQAGFPVPLRYLAERRQGKSNALNAAVAAIDAPVLAFTDDDVETPEDWLRALVEPLFERGDIDYTGGPVVPIWEGPCPPWLDPTGNLGGTIAVKDHGRDPFVFEDRRRTPLGVNMAVRRALFDRIGAFRHELGRTGPSLLGQEQAEFFCRSRQAGARGLYVPGAMVRHRVPAPRLSRAYFRRWWFWKGISHARLHGMHQVTELGVDLRRSRRFLGVPRFQYGNAVRNVSKWLRAPWRRNDPERAAREMALVYFAGYWLERQQQRVRLLRTSTVEAGRGIRRWWYRDRDWIGRLVALGGNEVRVDGCRFDVSHPQISNLLRARLLRGRYERSERALLRQWLDPAAPVVELGGGIGVVSTVINRRLRDPERHVVVEANPALIPLIEHHKAVNGAAYRVEHAAIDYSGAPSASLVVDQDFISAAVGGTGSTVVTVPATTLGALLQRYPWTGVTLVCDIEGVETRLVQLEGELLARHCAMLIIEVHQEFLSADCGALFARLDALGFEEVARIRKVFVFRQRRMHVGPGGANAGPAPAAGQAA